MNFAAGQEDLHEILILILIVILIGFVLSEGLRSGLRSKIVCQLILVQTVIRSVLRYGCSFSGIARLPSACWHVSTSATKSRARAVPLPLRRCGNLFSPVS